jgi:hypothetical protein
LGGVVVAAMRVGLSTGFSGDGDAGGAAARGGIDGSGGANSARYHPRPRCAGAGSSSSSAA